MRRTMMFSGVLIAVCLSAGCATVSGGWDTAKYKTGADCKPHPIDNTIPTLPKGAVMPSPNAVLMDPSLMPKGGKVIIQTAACDGNTVRVVKLIEDGPRVADPIGKMGPQKYRFEDVPENDWNK